MTGYILEFKRNYSPADTKDTYSMIPLGEVDSVNIVDATLGIKSSDSIPQGNIELAAAEVPTPGMSENFLSPVNDVS